MPSSTFQRSFDRWLDGILTGQVPSEIAAFSFNLAEPWCIELIGAARYSDDDSDWACEEVFRPKDDSFDLPESEVGTEWEAVLESAKDLVLRYLDRPSVGSARLKDASAVAVGFVDGELHKVWPR